MVISITEWYMVEITLLKKKQTIYNLLDTVSKQINEPVNLKKSSEGSLIPSPDQKRPRLKKHPPTRQ